MSMKFVVAVAALGLQAAGGVMIRPAVDKSATPMPDSLFNTDVGVYHKQVEIVSTSPDTGWAIVRPVGSLVETECRGYPKLANNRAPARLKFDGVKLTCRFLP